MADAQIQQDGDAADVMPQVIGVSTVIDDSEAKLRDNKENVAVEKLGLTSRQEGSLSKLDEEEIAEEEANNSEDGLLEPDEFQIKTNSSIAAKSGISQMAAASNLITCMIGASVLSLPHVIARSGWIFGPLMLATAGAVSCYGCLLVDQAITVTHKLIGEQPRNIGEVAEAIYGPRGRVFAVNLTCFFQICKCAVYLLVIGTNMSFWASTVTKRQCTLFATLIVLRLIFLRDISVISRWSRVGVVASVFYLLTITVGGYLATMRWPVEARLGGFWPQQPSEVPTLFAVMLYTYSPADVLPVLKADMSNPAELPSALKWAHMSVASIYIGLGTAGFFGWGREVEGNVLESMCDHPGCPGTTPDGVSPGSKWYVGYILSVAVIANLMVTIPVVFYCVFRVLESQSSKLQESGALNAFMRLVIYLGAVSIAVYMPFFVEILAVLSTAILVTLQVFLPVAMTFALCRRGSKADGGSNVAVSFGTLEVALLALGLLVFSVGMAGAVRNLAVAVAEGA